MITIRDLVKSYDGKKNVLDELSLTINNGEIFGFLGANGSGKSTTIKILTGIIEKNAGEVYVDKYDISFQGLEAKKIIGYVPDSADIFLHLKAREYFNFVADIHKIDLKTRKERISYYAKIFEIEDVLDQRLVSFSHGMRQKAVLVASLINDPDIWILDEPLTGLDPKAAFQLKQIMRERAARGKIVFFSTHVLDVAERLCTRIGIIKDGRIVFTGTLEEFKITVGSGENLEQLFLEFVSQ